MQCNSNATTTQAIKQKASTTHDNSKHNAKYRQNRKQPKNHIQIIKQASTQQSNHQKQQQQQQHKKTSSTAEIQTNKEHQANPWSKVTQQQHHR